MKELIRAQNKVFSDEDLIESLQKLGVRKGDILCVHTEIFGFGTPLLSKEAFLSAILECFWQVLGSDGTLIMPTFTYSFCKNLPFDKRESASTMGVLTEFFRKQKGVFRSDDPIFSFAIKGAKEKLFLKPCKTCFGAGSVYDELAKNDGKIMLFGTDKLGYTFTHFVEEVAGVSYRYFKEFSGEITNEKGETRQSKIDYYVRNLEKHSHLSVQKQIDFLKAHDNFKEIKFANAPIVLIRAKPYLDELLKAFKADETCLLEDVKA